ncbi:MAG: hypothetical protein AB7G93_20615 [Bdellovibrionales bacterium]
MTKIWKTAVAFTLLVFASSSRARFSTTQISNPTFNHCKEWGARDWDLYKDHLMTNYPDEEKMARPLGEFAKIYEKCKGSFSNFTKMTECLERMEYVARLVTKPLSARIHAWKSDEEYYKSQPKGLVDMPEEFKNGLPANWQDIVRKKDWKCVTFRSKLPTPSSKGDELSMFRTVILIPKELNGKRVMQRLLVTSKTEKPDETPSTFQIISTEHEYDGRFDEGYDKGARMNYRIYQKEGETLEHGELGDCAGCHMTGPIRIKPDYSFTPKFCGDYELETMNHDLLADSTMPNQERVLDRRLHPKPAMGNFPISNEGRVGVAGSDSVRCSHCHSDFGGERNPLLAAMNSLNPLSRLPAWITEIEIHKNMPPGIKLSFDERAKAEALLLKEQIDGIRTWLEDKRCEADPSPAPGPASGSETGARREPELRPKPGSRPATEPSPETSGELETGAEPKTKAPDTAR